MREPRDITKIGDAPLPQELLDITRDESWLQDSQVRRPAFGTGSRVIFFPPAFSIGHTRSLYSDRLTPHQRDIREKCVKHTKDVIDQFFPDYVVVKGELSVLLPNSEQPYHTDPRVFHRVCRRLHWPLKTNPGSSLWIGNTPHHMEVGTLWSFDNVKQAHMSENAGTTTRWHIIVDVIHKDRLDTILNNIDVDHLYLLWDNIANAIGRDRYEAFRRDINESCRQLQQNARGIR